MKRKGDTTTKRSTVAEVLEQRSALEHLMWEMHARGAYLTCTLPPKEIRELLVEFAQAEYTLALLNVDWGAACCDAESFEAARVSPLGCVQGCTTLQAMDKLRDARVCAQLPTDTMHQGLEAIVDRHVAQTCTRFAAATLECAAAVQPHVQQLCGRATPVEAVLRVLRDARFRKELQHWRAYVHGAHLPPPVMSVDGVYAAAQLVLRSPPCDDAWERAVREDMLTLASSAHRHTHRLLESPRAVHDARCDAWMRVLESCVLSSPEGCPPVIH